MKNPLNSITISAKLFFLSTVTVLLPLASVAAVFSLYHDRRFLVITGSTFVVTFILDIIVIRSMISPLKIMSEHLRRAAKDKFEIIGTVNYKNEFGELFKAYNKFVDSVERKIRAISIRSENMKLSAEKLKKNTGEYSVLYEIAKEILTVYRTEDLMNILLGNIVKVIKVEWAYIMFYNSRTNQFIMEAIKGYNRDIIAALRKSIYLRRWYDADRTVAGIVMKENKPVFSHLEAQNVKFRNFQEFESVDAPINTFLCVPLRQNGKFIGAVTCVNKSGDGKFTPGDVEFMQEASALFESGYRKITGFEKNFIDEKTGLYHPDYFRNRLQDEIERVQRSGKIFSFSALSVDNLPDRKELIKYNDHELILKEMGELIRDNLRVIDIPASPRDGLYWIILPDTDSEGSMIMCGRLREKIEENEFCRAIRPLHFTISGGVVDYQKGMTSEKMIEYAEIALARATRSGGNRVLHYDPEYGKEEIN